MPVYMTIFVIIYIVFALIFFLYIQNYFSRKKYALKIKKKDKLEEKINLHNEIINLEISGEKITIKYEKNKWNMERNKKKCELLDNKQIFINDNYTIQLANGGLCFESILWLVIATIMFVIILLAVNNTNNYNKVEKSIIIETNDYVGGNILNTYLSKAEKNTIETEYLENGIPSKEVNLEKRRELATHICAGIRFSLALMEDRTIKVSSGEGEFSDFHFEEWRNLVSISGDSYIIVGLNEDGDAYSTCLKEFKYSSDVSDWHDIIQISAGEQFAVGLTEEGEVVHVGRDEDGQGDAVKWKDIKQIATAHRLIVGIDKAGKLHFAGHKAEEFEAEYKENSKEWKDVVSVYASGGRQRDERGHVVGLKKGGCIVALGDEFPLSNNEEMESLDDIKLLALGDHHLITISTKNELTVIGDSGTKDYNGKNEKEIFANWPSKDIVELVAGHYFTLAVTMQGEVFAAGYDKQKQLEPNDWKGVMVTNME